MRLVLGEPNLYHNLGDFTWREKYLNVQPLFLAVSLCPKGSVSLPKEFKLIELANLRCIQGPVVNANLVNGSREKDSVIPTIFVIICSD